ncbi:hypothetical protein L6452_22287 [Arctium lappa]|uniref:Uncharacterized protein n=1 Tax=Arctium lappa TaxID=4217 RepID=A0ACB9B122_ARCLA|nr:hypothetical protein L6452_22287 [Arctium lappa]
MERIIEMQFYTSSSACCIRAEKGGELVLVVEIIGGGKDVEAKYIYVIYRKFYDAFTKRISELKRQLADEQEKIPDFDGQQLLLDLHHDDGRLGTVEGSSDADQLLEKSKISVLTLETIVSSSSDQ